MSKTTKFKAGITLCNRKKVISALLFPVVFILTCIFMGKYLNPEMDSVCYPRVGCFILSGVWSERPSLFNFFPQSPKMINTTLVINSRKDPNGTLGTIFLPSQSSYNLDSIAWGETDLVFFIIHGYTDDSTTWMQNLKQALLELGDVTVILVDWSSGASGYYPQVVANTRVVAREISIFLNSLSRQYASDFSSKRVHLIGHSLGAQISSYVGKAFQEPKRIHQITALDPAFPLFEGFPPDIRLHHDDANTVLVIHSNVGPWGLGIKSRVGTVDIYLNNGRDQPGCVDLSSVLTEPVISPDTKSLSFTSITDVVKDVLACSHRRAYEVLEDVLINLQRNSEKERFVAYPMAVEDNFDDEPIRNIVQHSLCAKASEGKCWKFNFNEDDSFFSLPRNSSSVHSSFFLPTTDKRPFCVRFAFLEVTMRTSSFQPEVDFEFRISSNPFGQNIEIYRGSISLIPSSFSIGAWVEFSCASLVSKKNKSLKIEVSVEPLQKKQVEPIPEKSTEASKLQWEDARLSFYDPERDKVIREWLHPSRFSLEIPSNACIQLTTRRPNSNKP